MELLFLGTGSAFTVGTNNYNSNIILIDNIHHRNLLIDCGSDVKHSLFQQGFSDKHIDNVYISHLHSDHVGGLEWLALARKFSNQTKPFLYAHHSLLTMLWNHTLKGGLSTLNETSAELTNFFEPQPIAEGQHFSWNNIDFQTVRTEHYHSNKELMPSYGLFFVTAKSRVFITTDTQFTPLLLEPFYRQATIIFQDCETSIQESGVHARFEQLISLPNDIKNKMWLYHYNSESLPDAIAEGFQGFIQPGQKFEI